MAKSLRQSPEFVEQVIELKAQNLSHRQIAERLNVGEDMIYQAVVTHNKGLSTIAEYDEHRTKQNGYTSRNNYVTIKRILRKDNGLLGKKAQTQEEFEQSIELKSLGKLCRAIDRQEFPSYQQDFDYDPQSKEMFNLHRKINNLPEPQRKAIKGYYLDRKTLQKIANEQGCSRQSVQLSRDSGIKNLRACLSPN